MKGSTTIGQQCYNYYDTSSFQESWFNSCFGSIKDLNGIIIFISVWRTLKKDKVFIYDLSPTEKLLTVVDIMYCCKSNQNHHDLLKYVPITKQLSNFATKSVFPMLWRISFITFIPASLSKRFFLSSTFLISLPVPTSSNDFPKNI